MRTSADSPSGRTLRIAVVGPCGAGKTTLIQGLLKHGYDARHVAQEHSYVPDMWQVLTDPDVLVYLDVSYESCTERKQLNWSRKEFQEQLTRLKVAKEKADIQVHTDNMTPGEVLKLVLEGLAPFLSK
jgi:thymidylate kinase